MKTRLRQLVNTDGVEYSALMFACPGCAELLDSDGIHLLLVNSPEMGEPSWEWDGNIDAPTLAPSILANSGEGRVCHSFLRDGVFEFLADSSHSLAGQFVPIPDLPVWAEELS